MRGAKSTRRVNVVPTGVCGRARFKVVKQERAGSEEKSITILDRMEGGAQVWVGGWVE